MTDTDPAILTLHPVTLAEARAYIERHHRHHPAPVGHRFSIGVADQDAVVRGVIVVGRPVALHETDPIVCPCPNCRHHNTTDHRHTTEGDHHRATR